MQTFSTTTWLDAISDNDLLKVKTFLDQGINVNITDEDGWAALHVATYKGHKDLVELLIKHGADIHQKKQNSWAALDMAID